MKSKRVICFLIVCISLLVYCGTAEVKAAQSVNASGEKISKKQTGKKSKGKTATKKKKSSKKKASPKKSSKKKSKGNKKSKKKKVKSYSPDKVVKLATKKVKAVGKIYIPDDLKTMLEAGEITQTEYDDVFPTDYAGYIEYYVAANMNEARDISGTVQFHSELDIAKDISKMYRELPQQYFYIEYHGTVMYGGKKCYVFYCYRA